METNEKMTNETIDNQATENVATAPVVPETPKKDHKGAWKGVLAVVLTAGVIGSTTLSAFNIAGKGSG